MQRASAGFWLTAGTLLSTQLIFATAPTRAADDLVKMQANAANVVMPTITYDNQRYSTLNQITAQNVGKLQVAWTFSTGVLRGHEGAPLVIGDVMYVHAPFPNTVFALDLNHDGKILWKYEPKQDPNVIPVMCCDTVNRGLAYVDGKLFLHQADTSLVALDAKTGKVVWSVKTGDPGKGETGTGAPMIVKDKVYVGVSGGEFGVLGWVTAYRRRTASRSGAHCPRARTAACWWTRRRPPNWASRSGPNSSLKSWEGDQWKIGGGTTWGWYLVRPEAQPDLLRNRQSLHLEPEATARRQQVVDGDLRPRRRYRHGQVGLPDDAARPVGL